MSRRPPAERLVPEALVDEVGRLLGSAVFLLRLAFHVVDYLLHLAEGLPRLRERVQEQGPARDVVAVGPLSDRAGVVGERDELLPYLVARLGEMSSAILEASSGPTRKQNIGPTFPAYRAVELRAYLLDVLAHYPEVEAVLPRLGEVRVEELHVADVLELVDGEYYRVPR